MKSSFRGIAEQKPKFEEKDPKKCAAYDCPCRACVNIDGGWTCSAHGAVPADKWPSVTRGLRDHIWLSEFIDEMRKMDRDNGDWRGFAMQFWANSDTTCQPHEKEAAIAYQNRMRGELLHRAGATKNRPQPRLPRPIQGRGYFADRAAA
jgi:hypothetical protein